jgi:hypothetical protein
MSRVIETEGTHTIRGVNAHANKRIGELSRPSSNPCESGCRRVLLIERDHLGVGESLRTITQYRSYRQFTVLHR